MRRALSLLIAGFTVAAGAAAAGADATTGGNSRTVAVRLESGALASAGVVAMWQADYGSFEWAEVARADLARLRPHGVAALRPYRIVLPRASFEPADGKPVIHAPHPSDALYVVQLRGPTKERWLGHIRARGARIVQYLAPFSYIVLADRSDISSLRRLEFVRWAGYLRPDQRFDVADLGADAGSAVGALVIDDARVVTAVAGMASSGMRITGRIPFTDVDAIGIVAPADPVVVERIASLPTLYSMWPAARPALRDEASAQVVAGNYSPSGSVSPGYQEWLQTHGFSGDGVTIAHVDSGVDVTHPDLRSRIAGCKDYLSTQPLCVPDPAGHGTHTAGIAVGTGASGAGDSMGFLYGLGVAPGAELYVQNFVNVDKIVLPPGPGSLSSLNRDSVLAGASISTNSWGLAEEPQGYDAPTRELDFAPRDGDLQTEAHEPLSFVLSIFNGEGGTSTQGTPDEAKNLLRVGASRSPRASGINSLSWVSAHGPALDGRILPDLVAPGEKVVSARAATATVSCSVPQLETDGAGFSSCTGTSMASPHVSAAAAIFTEYYRELTGVSPSPALIKAALINGAVDMAGGKDADGRTLGHVPDDKQGWGRLNLASVIAGADKSYLDQSVVLEATGQTWDSTVVPIDDDEPVRITLAWTDAPGPGLGGSTPAWVNDLDLMVGDAWTTYFGNAFGNPSTGWSVPGGAPDFANNVENVFLPPGVDPIALSVVASTIAGDGLIGIGDDTDQDFALVVSNGRLVSSGR